MKALFLKFLEAPGRDTYLAVRNALIASKHYMPYSKEMDGVREFIDKGKYEEVKMILHASMRNLLLSPRAHSLLAYVNRKLNDLDGADREQAMALACCKGILATGDGTEANPFAVVRISDEYDLIEHLGRRFMSQEIVRRGKQYLDRVTCADDTVFWFDITDAYSQLQRVYADDLLDTLADDDF